MFSGKTFNKCLGLGKYVRALHLPAFNGKSNEAGYFDHRVGVVVEDVEHHNHILKHVKENRPGKKM